MKFNTVKGFRRCGNFETRDPVNLLWIAVRKLWKSTETVFQPESEFEYKLLLCPQQVIQERHYLINLELSPA